MSGRIVAEFFDHKLTGERACDMYAIREGRVIDRMNPLPDGQFRFNDGIKTYKPVMFSGGWRIVVVKESE